MRWKLSTGWVVCALLIASTAHADSGRKQFTVGKRTYRQLSRIHESVEAEKYEEALGQTKELQGRARLNDHERALIWQTLGFVYSALERLDDAAKSFERCLALKALPEDALLNTQFNLGQVLMAADQYPKAIKVLEDWMSQVDNPTPQARYLLAGAYAQTGKPLKALPHIEVALKTAKRPRESWLTLALSLYLDVGRLKEGRDTLKRLIGAFPKRSYWLQLASVYGELGDEARALAVMELAYAQGHVVGHDELLHLSRLYVSQGLPYWGAQVLEKTMNEGLVKSEVRALEFLANAWIQSRELGRAVPPLGKAAQKSEDGELFLRLAHLHIEREAWADAVGALESCLKRGAVKHPGQVHLLKGIAHFSLKQTTQARGAFQKAGQFEATRASSRQWLKHLDER